MADVSLDDLIKQDKDKQKAIRTNVHSPTSRKPLKRKSSINKEISPTLDRTPTSPLNNSPTSLTSKIDQTTTNPSFRAKRTSNLKTPKDHRNSNNTNQGMRPKWKKQSRKINFSEP